MTRFAQMFLFFLVAIISGKAEAVLLDRVPFKSQSPPGDWNHNMNCGPTSALIVASYYLDMVPTTEDIRRELDWLYERRIISPQAGADVEYYDGNITNVYHLQTLLNEFFLFDAAMIRVNSDWNFLETELNKGNPVIVAVNIQMDPRRFGHFMVVVGLTDDEVILHDPGKAQGGFVRYSRRAMENSWNSSNRTSLVVDANEPTVSWHPDGTLLKINGSNRVYVLVGGKLFWIIDEQVFNRHAFDWRKILTVSEQELNCYDYGGEINWRPYRDLFQVDNLIYLMEKADADVAQCAIYRFASEAAFNSWNLNGPIRALTREVADRTYFARCADGGELHIRHGTVVRPTFNVPGFGADVVFVTTSNGVLWPFANWDIFTEMGYENQPIILVDETQFQLSFNGFGAMIDANRAASCGSIEPLAANGGNTDFDADGDGFSVENGDCDDHKVLIYPGATEICDNTDNDCDGVADEDASCPAGTVCTDDGCVRQQVPDEQVSAEQIYCTVTCPQNMRAYAWYGAGQQASGNPVIIETTPERICERGDAWLDFNCACLQPTEWACFDWSRAEIQCNHAFEYSQGRIDFHGEGEIWFTDFSCSQ